MFGLKSFLFLHVHGTLHMDRLHLTMNENDSNYLESHEIGITTVKTEIVV